MKSASPSKNFGLAGPEPPLPLFPSPISEELLAKLSPDFLNIQDRVSAAIERAGWRVQARNAWIPLAAAIITGAGAFFLSYFINLQQTRTDISSLQAKVDAIGSKIDLGTIDERLKSLEAHFRPTTQPSSLPGVTKP